jgi:hypothetical protein
MRRLHVLALTIFTGCGGAAVPAVPTVTIEAPSPAAMAVSPEAPVTPTTVKPKPVAVHAGAVDSVGVLECDAFIAKYEDCISRAGGPAAEAARDAFKAQREAFKQGAATPAGRAALRSACNQINDALAANPMCR